MAADEPIASVIIPLYHSSGTLEGCLEALAAQTESRFETVLVDSSGDDRARAIAARYNRTTYLRSERRLRPQAARNYGVRHAKGRLLIFTDPDIYPAPDWIETLIQRHEESPAILFGAIACHGRRWVDLGVHLVKFNICLPGGEPRPVPLGWSGNVLITREVFDRLGGWDTAHTQGDSSFSARARQAGCELRMEPSAVVFHDHEGVSLRGLFRERYARGREFARMEAAGKLGPASGGGAWARVAIMPLRLLGGLRRVGWAAAGAGVLGDFVRTFPVVLLGVTGWYAGLAAEAMRGSRERSKTQQDA